jgi:hypothetical protein
LNKQKTGHYINEQFPIEVEERRRKLYPVLREYRDKNLNNEYNKCVLVRDKLYVNGRLYDQKTHSLINQKRSSTADTNTISPGHVNPNINSDAKNNRYADWENDPKQNLRKPFPNRQPNIPRGRGKQKAPIDFSTPNRVDAFHRDRSVSLNRNKQKARSPLETYVKRVNIGNTPETNYCLLQGATNPETDRTIPKLLSPHTGPQSVLPNEEESNAYSNTPGH